jgi:hypothetical protein
VIVNTREINSFREKACREKAWTENAPGSQRNKKAARIARLFCRTRGSG